MGKRLLNATFGNLGSNSRSPGLQAPFRTYKEGAQVTSALLEIIAMYTVHTVLSNLILFIVKPPPTARQLLECQYWRLQICNSFTAPSILWRTTATTWEFNYLISELSKLFPSDTLLDLTPMLVSYTLVHVGFIHSVSFGFTTWLDTHVGFKKKKSHDHCRWHMNWRLAFIRWKVHRLNQLIYPLNLIPHSCQLLFSADKVSFWPNFKTNLTLFNVQFSNMSVPPPLPPSC
jgi:hypothetical protein